jgi:predicted nucleic acid-binding protein
LTFACLDASFVIEFLRGQEDTKETYLRLKSQKHRFATATVVAFELFRGVDRRGRLRNEEEAVRRLLSQLVVWHLDLKAAERARRVYTDLECLGQPMGVNDCLTATIALASGCQKMMSRDLHFGKVPGPEILTY